MPKKKRATAETVIMDTETTTPVIETVTLFESLSSNLAEIAKREGVTGYILRNATSAVIDIKDTLKLVDYAILSSQIFDCSEEFSRMFNMGNIENVLVEGKDEKMLCFATGDCKATVLMQKNADHKGIWKAISRNLP